MLPMYSQVARLKIQETEFEKTPKRSIKRYLYPDFVIAYPKILRQRV